MLRGGSEQKVPTANVVLDDALLLRAGDQVTADACVLESRGLEAGESLLTGESNPVAEDARTEVLSASIVVAGRGKARVIRVALLPVALIVANGEILSRGGWLHAITSGTWTSSMVGVIAGIIAIIPPGLVLLASVAVGGVRLAGNKVLVQELAAVKGLARVDVLRLDKTGTLTEGHIIFDGGRELTEPAEPDCGHAGRWFAADPEANSTSRSLEAAFEHDGGSRAVSSVTFSSARKFSSVTFDGGTRAPARGSLAPRKWC